MYISFHTNYTTYKVTPRRHKRTVFATLRGANYSHFTHVLDTSGLGDLVVHLRKGLGAQRQGRTHLVV